MEWLCLLGEGPCRPFTAGHTARQAEVDGGPISGDTATTITWVEQEII